MTGFGQSDDETWERFVTDAGMALRAQRVFEDAVAWTLDNPFDPAAQRRVVEAVGELAAATPAAIRAEGRRREAGPA